MQSNQFLKAAIWAAGTALGIAAAVAAARRTNITQHFPTPDRVIQACDRIVSQLDHEPVKA